MSHLTRVAARTSNNASRAVAAAGKKRFIDWVICGNFTADREPVNFDLWRYLRPIYEAVPAEPTRLDLVIMKSSQGGATILGLLWSLWLTLRAHCRVGYFLPTADAALKLSADRYIRLVRENPEMHRLMGDPDAPQASRVIDEGSAATRRIGQSILYFTFMGGKITTEALPLDALVFDEVQEMLLSEIEKAEERLAASPLQAIMRVSTANFAGSDIHYFFERSDQREFHTTCRCADGVVLPDAWDSTVGPLCIDRGNGTTPSVPRDPFYFCPRCKTILADVQDGRFIPHAPANPRIGFHWAQMLSPRQTAARILQKWVQRVSTKNFYNRVLGRPYADPNTLPVTQAHLEAAQNPNLTWGPPLRKEADTFMGIDQMGQLLYIVVKARTRSQMRVVWLEIVEGLDTWRRAGELMKEFHVRVCTVEKLPNFDNAQRFAHDFDGRVFLADYQDLADELVLWGDRPRDRITVRRTESDARTRYTVKIDQYQMMAWSLGKWTNREIETPDARILMQSLRTDRGIERIAICREMFWLHLQRVALVTEYLEGKEDERRFRRAVKKVGIDPHFAFANMLCDVAWVRRFGTEMILLDDHPTPNDSQSPAPSRSPYLAQLMDAMPEKFSQGILDPERIILTCGECSYFDPKKRYCTLRDVLVAPETLS